jgi:GNAT superfamily N-acetyltransferase
VAITIRGPRPADRKAILALIPRLRAFGPTPVRSLEDLDRAEFEALSMALDELPETSVVLVAESDEVRGVAGVAYVETQSDYFTKESHAHLAILSVAEEAEGHGVGRALLDAVDEWTRERGYRFVTLNVFAGNERARRVYERAGYSVDAIKYLKEV